MKPVEYHPYARAEQARAIVEYANVDPDLAQDFRADLNTNLSRVRSQPLFFPIEVKDVRRCTLSGFPYSIIYREMPTCIWVIAITHHSRNPGYWLRRRRTP